MNGTRKVGRITVAVSLVAIGAALLLDNLGLYTGALTLVARLWPAALIGYGVEYLIYMAINQQTGQERRLRMDIGGAFLLAVILALSVGYSAFRTYVLPNVNGISIGVGPSESKTESKTVSAVDAKGLSVDVGLGDVVLQPGAGDQLKVEASYTIHGFVIGASDSRRALDDFKLIVTEGETIRITSEAPPQFINTTIRYTIYAPPGLKVKAQTGAGRIEATNYKGDLDLTSNVGRIDVTAGAGVLNAYSGSGHVQVRDFQGPVTARTNVGSLDMTGVVGALLLDSGTGSISVREFAGGALVAETRTGRIDASARSALEGDVRLKTQTGSISLDLPGESSVRATAQTRTGSITVPSFMTTNRSGTSSSAVGTSGDGRYSVTLEASTGRVSFTTR
jgi:DUF4097 and DUF4098 domain-containing protein YvlB